MAPSVFVHIEGTEGDIVKQLEVMKVRTAADMLNGMFAVKNCNHATVGILEKRVEGGGPILLSPVGPGPCIFPIEYAICQTGFWAICHMPCTVFWLMQYAISIYAYIGIFIGKSATYVGDTRF
jgi:hypothetical protein